jgi:hypothetical protein
MLTKYGCGKIKEEVCVEKKSGVTKLGSKPIKKKEKKNE